MALNTGSVPGEQQSVFAESPQFPSNLGKIDVGAIYDAVSKNIANTDQLAKGTRAAVEAGATLPTELQQQAAQRSLIPGQTGALAGQAQAATAEAANKTRNAGYLAGLSPAVGYAASQGAPIGQTTKTSRVYDTSDPKNPKLVDTEDSFITDPKTGQSTRTGTKVQEVYSPRDINVFREHTDQNGNIVTTTGTYRQLDLSKPAFQIDKEGNIAPIVGPDGQPVNAALIGATGTSARGTPISSGVAGDAGRIANYEQIIADHPDTAPTLQPLIDGLKKNLDLTNQRTDAQGSLDTAKANAAGAPKAGTPEYDQARIDDLKKQIGDAAADPESASLVPSLTATLQQYQAIQAQRIKGLVKPGKASGFGALATAPGTAAPAAPSPAPSAAPAGAQGTPPANPPQLANTAAYQAFQGGWYKDPNGVVGYKVPTPAAAPAPTQ